MDALESLRQEVRQGRISSDRLLDLLASLQRQFQATQQQLQATQEQLQAAQQRIAELEKHVGSPPPTAKLDEPFSLRSEEQRQQARGQKQPRQPKGRRGRFKTKDKIAQAERSAAVYPEGVPPQECQLSHVRPVWRLENGRAVLIAYQIYRGPKGSYGRIPGVLQRSEFGLEIVTEIAYLVYVVGLSFDKVCQLLHFFQNLRLSKAQADKLLYRLARHWERQFDVLCTLLANALVVHGDETSWSIASVWALLSEKARLLLFGVHKDGDTLQQILDPETFAGIFVSDHAGVYNRFRAAQKCWAHLLRKAIKLTLQDPQNADYRSFTDRLLAIYREACRIQRDRRFSAAGRAAKVEQLDDAILELCLPLWFAEKPPPAGLDHDYYLLGREVFRLMIEQELFTFVTAPPVEQPNGVRKPVAGTNNEAERSLRGVALARKTGRSNKSSAGARRQTVLTSVLESLRLYLASFTLASVLDELQHWWTTGRSCFEGLLEQLGLTLPPTNEPILDRLLPSPSPSG